MRLARAHAIKWGSMHAARIALFLRALDNDYQELQKESCRAAARRHNFSVREVSALNDADRQVQQIEECLQEPAAIRPIAVLVNPVLESSLRRR